MREEPDKRCAATRDAGEHVRRVSVPVEETALEGQRGERRRHRLRVRAEVEAVRVGDAPARTEPADAGRCDLPRTGRAGDQCGESGELELLPVLLKLLMEGFAHDPTLAVHASAGRSHALVHAAPPESLAECARA